ncbi:hypothetical protein GGX14DRAFT_523028 [Mycena pura]|uniref:Uncharacterized protein n=1 Tax=Mycena pura TaxID=153505 RepID=A0AAD6Y881_9AGAR|nr:hypothetical protein GGX14DRAFT_523028 [Mycena pura]
MAWSQLSDGSYRRPLGDSEYALFSASQSAARVGDMFLHMALRAPRHCFRPERVRIAWSLIRTKNPLLMSKVLAHSDPANARFSFTPPLTLEELLQEAAAALRFSHETKQELITAYMDGPGVLSNDFLSCLVVSEPENSPDKDASDYDIFMCAPHFIGDGTALHQSTHELICLVTSNKTDGDLLEDLEIVQNWGDMLPLSVEARLSIPSSSLGRAACKVNYLQNLSREIGGHAFSRIQRGPKHTVLEECELSETQTAIILTNCKTNGVTVNHALTALCNIAWARCTSQPLELPVMLYTAVNLRPHLALQPSPTHWFLALAYFTMSFPAFAPTERAGVWHRARLAKAQMQRAVRSPLLPARALLSASARARRAPSSPSAFVPPPASPSLPARPAASAALLGISLIGDLDRTYARAAYGPGVHLRSVATASRLKPGGLLLLAHSFGARLVLQLCWDSMGFAEGEVERFWAALTGMVTELLC